MKKICFLALILLFLLWIVLNGGFVVIDSYSLERGRSIKEYEQYKLNVFFELSEPIEEDVIIPYLLKREYSNPEVDLSFSVASKSQDIESVRLLSITASGDEGKGNLLVKNVRDFKVWSAYDGRAYFSETHQVVKDLSYDVSEIILDLLVIEKSGLEKAVKFSVSVPQRNRHFALSLQDYWD